MAISRVRVGIPHMGPYSYLARKVIHIMPFPCMPEAAVSALLDDVSRDYDIPVNPLVFDQ